MLVNPAKHPHVKVAEGKAFIDWLVSQEGQDDDRELQDRQASSSSSRTLN